MQINMTVGEETRTLDLASMPIKDAMECERLTSWSWIEWRENLSQDRASAVAFAWWLAGKRAGLDVGRFSELDLDLAKMRWSAELSDDERELLDAQEAASDEDSGDDVERPTGLEQEETPTG